MISIRAKLQLYSLATIVLVAGTVTSFSIISARNRMLSDFELSLLAAADAVSESIFDDLYMLDIRQLRFQLNVAKTNSALSAVYVLDDQGHVLTDGTDENALRDQSLDDPFAFLAQRAHGWITDKDDETIKVGGPIAPPGLQSNGTLILIYSLSSINHRLREMVGLSLVGSLICIITGAAITWLFAERFTRPIRQLTQVADRVSSGEENVAIDVVQRDEIGVMANSLRLMLERLKRSHAETKQLAQSLEVKVQERTHELEDAKRAAEDSNVAKTRFLANMSHELRTPLNAIIGYSEMLHEELTASISPEQLGDLRKVSVSAHHLLNLINDLLDLSKIEAGKMEFKVETIPVPPLLDEIVAMIKPILEKNSNRLVVNQSSSAQTITADPTKLKQVLFNLLNNACKFTTNGMITLTVATNTEPESVIQFRVLDTGIGMTAEQMNRLFTPFTQVHAQHSGKYGGTGLGLALSREFCRMMGGDVTVSSIPGHGTVFCVTLPHTTAATDVAPAGKRITLA